jgi:hypothetical protein
MKTQIDLKSAVCGLFIGIITMLAVGAGESSNQIGRYQIAGGNGQFIIVDTTTGQEWEGNFVNNSVLIGFTPGFREKKTGS